MNLKEHAKKLKTDIPIVYRCLKNKNTPKMAKIMAAITIAYALSPIDLIPDFIPVLGYFDDLILLPLFIIATVKLIPVDIWEKETENANRMGNGGIAKKWYFAIPILLFWLVVFGWVVKKIVK